MDCSPPGSSVHGVAESDTTEQLHFRLSLSCTGEGNGTPLQCSCLENPRERGAWWAAVYGVAQSQTRLKRLSSSSRRRKLFLFSKHYNYNKSKTKNMDFPGGLVIKNLPANAGDAGS